ncbi:MAG: hypothetical protein PHU51_04195 [Candidatus Nanoarchaeia archaeon]|nr:hypothetical protein [Candidatus Nanoarchaeia archaeon]
MDYFNELMFEKEKERLLKTYNCKTLDEVIEFLKKRIKEQNNVDSGKKNAV